MPNECRDPFIEGLRCVRSLRGRSCRSLENYLVDDLTDHLQQENFNTILLTESPHKSEVCKRYPLAGDAGAIVTGAFIGTMGEILYCKRFDDTVNPLKVFRRIGIMNVSRLPLQRKAYKDVGALCKKDCNLKNLLGDLQKIKKRLEKGKQPPSETRNVICTIKDDLKRRIDRLSIRCPDACYVACGSVAKYFLKEACPNVQTDYIPHPSKPSAWLGVGTQQEQVRAIVDRLRSADTDPSSSTSSNSSIS